MNQLATKTGPKHSNMRIFVSVMLAAFVFVANLFIISNAFAEETSSNQIVETTLLGNLKDDGKGCGVYTILNLVIDVFSMGVGILGVIGISVVGLQYLTAKDNEQQATKAKRRMVEIIIGLVAYAVLYVGLQWLLPGAKLNDRPACETVTDEQLTGAAYLPKPHF